MAADAIEDDLARRFRIDRPTDTLGAKIFKSTHWFFAHAEQSSDAWPFHGRATGRGFCIPCSAVDAVFLEPVDGGTAQRSTRFASWRCTADRLARQSTVLVWISLSIRFAFISLKLRLMRWPMRPEFAW